MRIRYVSALGVLAVLAAGCATLRQAVVPSPVEAGGPASGRFVVSGEKTPLVHAYVVSGDRADPGAGARLRIILFDRPIHPPALADRRRLAPMVDAGDVRAVEILLDEDGRAEAANFFHDRLPAGLSVIVHPRFEPRRARRSRLAGRVVFDDPGFTADFKSPIYHLPPPAKVDLPPDATPAQRARAPRVRTPPTRPQQRAVRLLWAWSGGPR